MTDAWFPPQSYPVITAGLAWHWEYPPFKHSGDLGPRGTPFDWTADPDRWLFNADIKDRNEQLLAHLSSTGTRDGDIAGLANGLIAFDMSAEKTVLLPITRPYASSSDPRVDPWRSRGALFFDLVITDMETDTPWPGANGLVTVQQLVTTP